MKIETEEGNEDSFQHALKVLPNYSCVTVEVKVERMKEVRLEENRRRARTKEVVSEEIKRAMGIHTAAVLTRDIL